MLLARKHCVADQTTPSVGIAEPTPPPNDIQYAHIWSCDHVICPYIADPTPPRLQPKPEPKPCCGMRSWSSINVLCTESGVATRTDPPTPPPSLSPLPLPLLA